MPTVISVKNLVKTYIVGEVQVKALRGINLDVERGEFLAVSGTSGSGKSTFMHIVGCLDKPTSGQYLLDGQDVSRMSKDALAAVRNKKIGFVFQGFNLLSRTSALDNVELPLLYGGSSTMKTSDRHKRAHEMLELVGLDPARYAKRYPRELSGGQQQRVGVARALAADPVVLLMDEPFSAVDPIVRDDLQQELLHLQRELGKTVVFVTHDIDEAFLLGEQVVIFRTGGIVAQKGTPAEILSNPVDDFVASFVGADRGKRALHIETTATGDVLVDSDGRTAGVLAGESTHEAKAATLLGAGAPAQGEEAS